MPASTPSCQIHPWPFEDILTMVMPGQDKEKQKWSEDWGEKEMRWKEKNSLYCLHHPVSGNFYWCFLFAWDSLLLMLFLFFLSFPCAFLHQLCLKIFCMCPYCKPSYFSRDLVQWGSSFFFFLPQGLGTSVFLATHFRGQWKMCS